MGKREAGKIATLGAWGIRRREAAAEISTRGVRKQQGKCAKEEFSWKKGEEKTTTKRHCLK